MSKIAIRGGHCPKVTGARVRLDELTSFHFNKDYNIALGTAACVYN